MTHTIALQLLRLMTLRGTAFQLQRVLTLRYVEYISYKIMMSEGRRLSLTENTCCTSGGLSSDVQQLADLATDHEHPKTKKS
jgi:hypothetical protein